MCYPDSHELDDDQRPDDAMAGAFEAIGPEPVATVAAPLFREAMSRLGAAVHVVTTAGPAARPASRRRRSARSPMRRRRFWFALTARAMAGRSCARTRCSRSTRWAPIARSSPTYSPAAPASSCAERFATGLWSALKTGAPVLAAAVVAFDCRVIEIKAVASHNVIFGAVEDIRLGPAGPALVYHERAYKRV